MRKKRVMYVTSAIEPFLGGQPTSDKILELAKQTRNAGNEVRIFMPRFGVINERKHQLHEVIRLSGMNIILNDVDKCLVVKVSSIPKERMQVYFIDNDEYFCEKNILTDKKGNMLEYNDEKMIFFARGIVDTLTKANWSPDVIHISGWIGYLLPLYLKTYYKNNLVFENVKIVISIFDDAFEGSLDDNLVSKIKFDEIEDEKIENLKQPNYNNLLKVALENSDAVIKSDDQYNEIIKETIQREGRVLDNPSDKDLVKFYNNLF